MSGSGRETLLDVREAHTESRSGRKALPDVRELLGGLHGCPGVVKSPSRMTGSVRDSFPDVRVFGRPSQMTGSVRESFPDVQEESGAPYGCLGVVGTPF